MRLNLGCGDAYAHGWHNVDQRDCPWRRDETVDLTGPLPWAERSVVLAYAGHVLEHLTPDQCLSLLTGLRRCMVPDGRVLVVGPDLDLVAKLGTGPFHTLDEVRHGGCRWPGDEHRWECTTAAVMDLLTGAGWVDVTDVGIANVPVCWPVVDRAPRWQLAVGALAW